ncbi:MAG TPA: AAA family ATPase, partial [Acidimicrobiales bacterium]
AQGGLVLFGRCDQEAIVPYQPIVEALDGYVAATPADELPAMDEAARAELAAVLPSLAGPRAAGGGPDGRARLFEAVTTLVAAAATDRAVLLVLDDLQWADDDTLLLVRHLLRRAGDAPVLVVAISRDHDVAPGSVLGDVIHALDRDGWVRRLVLRGLEEPDVRVLLRQSAPTPRDQVALARRLVAETAGNPFLVTEMLRAESMFETDSPIPLGVQELVAGRLGRLGVAATELLRAAAVAGARFELDLVAAAAGLDETDTLDGLDAALGSGLVAEESAERYRFPHDIVRRTLVAQLSGARRRALHARLADAIESRRSDRLHDYTAILAHHTSATASPQGDRRAVRWSRAAAAQATERRALAEAVRLERQALTHVPADDGGQRAEVLTDLALALLAAGDPGGEPTLIEAATVARQHGRSDVLARAALALADRSAERPELRTDAGALVDAALGSFRPTDDGWLVHARLLARAVALAGTTGASPSDAALQALRRRLDALGGPDHLDERIALADDLAILADAAGSATSAVLAAHERAMAAALGGDDETVQACLRVIEEAAAKSDDRVAAALAAEHEAANAAMTGHFDDALVAIEGAARARGVLDGAAAAGILARRHRAVLAWMLSSPASIPPLGSAPRPDAPDANGDAALELLVRGEDDGARLIARDIVAGARPLPPGDERLHVLGVLALVAADLRDPGLVDAVRVLLAAHADLTCGVGYRTFAGVAAFHLGRLAAVSGDWADAERHMLVALRRYSALQARPWVAFTQGVLADVLEARGRPSDRESLAALRGESRWATATLGLRDL